MPSKSPAQHRLMEAAAHDPKFAKKAGVPQKVAKDFVAADKKTPRPASLRKGQMMVEFALSLGALILTYTLAGAFASALDWSRRR